MQSLFSLACLWATLPIALAQDSKPCGPVHQGQPTNCIAWHTVKKGDDCDSVPKKHYISRQEFMAWNPAVSKDCLENFWLNSAYCVRIDGTSAIHSSTKTISTSKTALSTTQPTKSTATTTKHTSTLDVPTTKGLSSTTETQRHTTSHITTSTVNATYSVRHPVSTWNITTPTTDLSWPPKATQQGQPVTCNIWHLARGGEGCQDVLNRYSAFMKKDDFFKWNPEVHSDCSGLFVGYWYCVGIKSNATNNLQWSTSTPPFTPPPDPTTHKPTKLTPANSDFTPTPTHGSMPKDCINFHQAVTDESCRDILKTYSYLSKEQFFKYNAVLKDNCGGLWKGNWYCVAVKSEALMPPTVTATPSAVPNGSPKNCTAWYYTTSGETCDQLANMFGTFGVKEFIAMNPSVLDDCDDIDDNTWYCVAEPGTPTTRTADLATSTLPATVMPTQSGIASDCKEYWLVSKKDTCKSIRRANSISLEKLVGWNPALGSKCTGLKPDSYVCVDVDK